MRRKSILIPLSAMIFAGLSARFAYAQSPSILAEQLKARYKPVKLSGDSNGIAVVEPGTLLSILKSGILGVPFTSIVGCASKVQDGELHAPGGFCATMVKDTSGYFQIGQKVYPQKIDVNVKKEQISFHVVSCDTCNGVDPPTYFKSDVVFQFAKGYLETAPVDQVQAAIAVVFAVDTGNGQTAAAPSPPAAPPPSTPPPPVPPPPVEQPLAPIAPPPPPVDQPPPTIEIGQTIDQVLAAMGQPQKIAKVGTKQIYFFKDLKITFVNGKVSDVQ